MRKTTIFFILLGALSVMAQNKVFTVGGHTIEMVPIKGGTFYMGAQSTDPAAPNYDPDAETYEGPVHKVQVADFWISKYPVSQGLWEAVTGSTPHSEGCIIEGHCQLWYEPYVDATAYPAYYLSYRDVQMFVYLLNEHPQIQEQITFGYKEGFYAPTEAQWEYAARGGANATYHIYAGSDNYDEVAWTSENCTAIPKMGLKQPNALGLYDMCGGMAEWCRDMYAHYDEYNRYVAPDSILVDPINSVGIYQVQRGGLFGRPAVHNRVSSRAYADADKRSDYQGFRLVMQAPIPSQTTTAAQGVLSGPTLTQQGSVLTFADVAAPTQLTVYNLDGKALLQQIISAASNRADLIHLPAGMYVVACGSQRQLIVLSR